MKPALESQFLAQSEPAIAAIASAGLSDWQDKLVDVELLCELPLVKEQLTGDHDGAIDADARRYAVEQAIQVAIGRLPERFRLAAEADFGLGDYWEASKRKRAEGAGAALEKSYRWYEDGQNALFPGKTPREYVVALVTCALCDVADPVSYLSRQATATETQDTSVEETTSPRRQRLEPRPLIVAGAAVLFVAVIAAVSGFFNVKGRELPLPPVGTVVDASSGKIYPQHTALASSASYGAVEGGNILRACDTGITQPCEDPAGEDTYARPGDTLKFRLYLKNRFSGPIQLLKVRFTWEQQKSFATIAVDWIKALARHATPDGAVDSIEMSFTDHRTHRLLYIPGSSALYSISEEGPGTRLARLPDGIMSSAGIQLTDFGPPASCLDCIPVYARIIEFSAHVA